MAKKDRTLIIDAQVFQSAAWNRGMGKYSLNFLKALLAADARYSDVYLLFTDHLPIDKHVEKALEEAAPRAKRVSLNLAVPKNPFVSNLRKLQLENEAVLENFVRKLPAQEAPADFLILSLFIEQVCSVFPASTRNVLLFYDLIPYLYSDRYSRSPDFPNYLTRYRTLFAADKVLTISQSAADDLIVYLGLNAPDLCNINGAPVERAHQKPQKPGIRLPGKYILMPTGEELRKNNTRAVQGYEDFRKDNPDVGLVITSSFQQETQVKLKAISPELVFTGNVTEAELRWLYEHAEAVLFMSEYEGLGLPILEGVEAGKPVVCSNLTVFNEMSADAFYYANHFNLASISDALSLAVAKEGWSQKLKQYPAITAKYTWPQTAKAALDFLAEPEPERTKSPKLRLAVLTPDPAGYSAIGKVVMQLHPALSRHFEVDYYLDLAKTKTKGDFSRASYLPYIAPTYKATEFNAQRYAEYDAVIYHIGNSEHHMETVKNALYLPGYAIIHDTHATGLYNELSRYGYISEERRAAEHTLDRLLKTTQTEYLASIINAQRGVIVHSQYAQKAIQQADIGKVPVTHINLPVGTPRLERRKLDQSFSVGFAGIIHEVKGIQALEEIITAQSFAETNITIFGIPVAGDDVLQRLGAYPNVTLVMNPTDFQFQTLLQQVDVVMSYRSHYNGETSLTIVEAMRYGTVPLVRKIGWFDELPDATALKAASIEELLGILEDIRTDAQRYRSMSAHAKELMADQFSYEHYAAGLARFITAGQSAAETGTKLPDVTHRNLKAHRSLQDLERLLESS